MGDILHRIPYDESGNLLSFITLAQTVYIGDLTLPEYLENLKNSLKGADGTNGKDGTSIDLNSVLYIAVSKSNNNTAAVSLKPNHEWSTEPPILDKDTPNLWKRTKVTTYDAEGNSKVLWEYQYCGSLGTPGTDGSYREWIFKIADATLDTRIQLLAELDASLTDSDFSTDGFHLEAQGWLDEMVEITDPSKVLWAATRDKIGGNWQAFTNLHIYNRKAEDGTKQNNLYTITDSIDSTSWEYDKNILLQELHLENDTIKNIPSSSRTEYTWLDQVPNASNSEIIYQATCYFTSGKCVKIDNPIRITGPAGVGSDGAGIEFAYYPAVSNSLEIPEIIGSASHFSGGGGWYDTAGESSITSVTPFLYMSYRQGQYTDDSNWYWIFNGQKYGISSTDKSIKPENEAPLDWNYGWSKPLLWSSWGQDGVDGDGVLYVFLRLTQEEYDWVIKYGWDLSNEEYNPPTKPINPGNDYVEDDEGIQYPDPRPIGTPEETSLPLDLRFIDLGLPSGTLWSNVNGIHPDEKIANSDAGGYFAIGELTAYENASGSKKFIPSDYLNDFYEKPENIASGWQQMQTVQDCGKGMDPFRDYVAGGSKFGDLWPREYDIAAQILGRGYRIPTKDNWLELFALPKEWIIMNGHPGYKFTGYNGNTLFLPAFGCARDGHMNASGSSGLYWSSSPAENGGPGYFGHYYFYNGGGGFSPNQRYHGRPFRVVYNKALFENEPDEFELPSPNGSSIEKEPEEKVFYVLNLSPLYVEAQYNTKSVNGIARLYKIVENKDAEVIQKKSFTVTLDFNLTASSKIITHEESITYEGEDYTDVMQITLHPAEVNTSFIVYGMDEKGELTVRTSFTTELLGTEDSIVQNIGKGLKIVMIIAPKDSNLHYSIYKEDAIDSENWREESEPDDIFVKLYPNDFDITAKYSIRLEADLI